MTVEHELIKATGIGKAGGEPRQEFLKRLLTAALPGHLSDDDWAKLTEPAQDWVNEAMNKHHAQEQLPKFSDLGEMGRLLPVRIPAKHHRRRSPRHRPSQPCQKNIGVITRVKLTSAASMSATASLLRPKNGLGI